MNKKHKPLTGGQILARLTNILHQQTAKRSAERSVHGAHGSRRVDNGADRSFDLTDVRRMEIERDQKDKNRLIQSILDIEWQMFSSMPTSLPRNGDKREALFRLVRGKSHGVVPKEVLEAYLLDLKHARRLGRNLMEEKYARRAGKLPPLKENPLIHQIVEIECEWKRAMARKYPYDNRGRDERAFRKYLATELETYSDHTIDLYYQAVLAARRARRNLVEEREKNPLRAKEAA